MKVNGKVVLVTGAGNGMGRELTLELLRRGAKVAAVDRPGATDAVSADDVGVVARVLGQRSSVVPGDRTVSADGQRERIRGETQRRGVTRPGLQHRDTAGGIGRKPLGHKGSGAAGADDQDVGHGLIDGMRGRSVRSRMTPAHRPAP